MLITSKLETVAPKYKLLTRTHEEKYHKEFLLGIKETTVLILWLGISLLMES